MDDQVRILGVDPGSRVMGLGIIEYKANHARCLHYQQCQLPKQGLPDRLGNIFVAVTQIISEYQPHEAAVEEVFMNKHAQAALTLGHARGAIIAAIVNCQLPVFEYAAREVKKAVVGYGAAQKDQVQIMMKALLNLPEQPPSDAADALAVALCHAHMRQSVQTSNS